MTQFKRIDSKAAFECVIKLFISDPSGIKATKRMAIRIKARSGEPVEQMMRRFKKLCEKEGLNKDVKRKQFFEKPSERRRRQDRKSVKRREPIRP